MSFDIQRARQELDQLPSSSRKREAQRLLAEMEAAEAETLAQLEKLEQALEKCAPTAEQIRFYRWVNWFAAGLGGVASYVGITAMVSKSYCASSRGSWSCVSGLNAQLQGATILLVGAMLLLLPLPESRWRSVALWIAGLSLISAFLGSLLLR